MPISEDPRRQPLRNRHPRVPRGQRTRAQDRRDLRRGGQARAAPLQGRRGLPGRRGRSWQGLGPIEAICRSTRSSASPSCPGADAIHPGYGLLSESPEFAEACAAAGITFIGPTPETMRRLGNKVAARNLAIAVGVPVVPATEPLPDDMDEVEGMAAEIGYPLMLKASWGGGGRGMRADPRPRPSSPARSPRASARPRPPSARTRSISKSWSSAPATSRCRSSATRTATSSTCSSATARSSAATRRSSSARRRPISTRRSAQELCGHALKIARAANYVGAGTVEFLMDADTGKFYFIEVNPRIQVEHTVTEEVTGIDIVKAQIRIVEGAAIGTPESGVPAQEDIRLNGHALQCRITTEDPEQNFIPDYGRITAYRGATGFGIRLDGGTAYSGAVITRFYDPLLEKVTAWAPTPEEAIARMDRALREFRIRGVATNLTFLESDHRRTRRSATTATRRGSSTRRRSCSPQVKRQDRATKLLTYLADVTVNGHPETRGRAAAQRRCGSPGRAVVRRRRSPRGTKQKLDALGPEKFAALDARAEAGAGHRHDDARRAPVAARDPHAHATTSPASPRPMRARCRSCSRSNAGAARPSTSPCASSPRIPWERLRHGARGGAEHPAADAAARRQRRRLHQLSRQCRAATSSARRRSGGIDLFRVFDCLNWVENMRVAMDAVVEEGKLCEAAICYTGDILDPARAKYDLKYYVGLAKELEAAGAHILARQGHGRAAEAGGGARAVQGAARGDRPADPLPHPRHLRHRRRRRCWRRSKPASTPSTRRWMRSPATPRSPASARSSRR